MGDEFERFNGRWTPERAEQAKEAADNWKRLTLAGQGLGTMIGGSVTPAIMELVIPLREWIANNKELVAQNVQNTIREIGNSFKETDWKGVAAGIGMVWKGFKGVAELLGAKGTVLVAAALIFGPIAVSALSAAKALAVLAVQIGLVTLRLGFLLGLQVFKFFADLVTGIRLAIPALAALDIALSANPVGAVVLAIGALAAAAYLVYDHWKPIAAFFSGVWEKIKAVWQPAKQWFSDLWGGVLRELTVLWNAVKPIIDKISAFWNRSDSRRRSSAENDSDARHSGARAASAVANRAGFNRALAGAMAYGSAVLAQMPVISGLQHLHDVGQHDRLARERQSLSGSGFGRGGGPQAANGKVDVNVNLSGLPRGSQANAAASGSGLNLKVGKSFQDHR
jgi:hypothetical protein